MGKTVQVRVDETMVQTLTRIQKEVADGLKKQYNLDEVTIHGTIASQVVAARLRGASVLKFRIKKNGANKGILELE